MTDPKPEDLIPLSDKEIAFAVRLAICMDGRGRPKAPPKVCTPWETIGQQVAEHFRRSRVLVFQKPLPDPPPSGIQTGTGPGSVYKHRP
jgi:hypothetical protein